MLRFGQSKYDHPIQHGQQNLKYMQRSDDMIALSHESERFGIHEGTLKMQEKSDSKRMYAFLNMPPVVNDAPGELIVDYHQNPKQMLYSTINHKLR